MQEYLWCKEEWLVDLEKGMDLLLRSRDMPLLLLGSDGERFSHACAPDIYGRIVDEDLFSPCIDPSN